MKILKLLNKKFFFIFFLYLVFLNPIHAEDNPIDIWNLEKKENETVEETVTSEGENNNDQISVFDMQSDKNTGSIELDENLISKEVKIVGLYDPEEHGLTIDMWTNSDGQKLKSLFDSLEKINLSNDALEIMEVSLLTNAHYPNQNITENEFLKFKSDWLIKNSNLELIEEFLVNNQIVNSHPKLTRHLLDNYLSKHPNINEIKKFWKDHTAAIKRFHRYPHRNEIMGRKSTPEEIQFLEGPNSSW